MHIVAEKGIRDPEEEWFKESLDPVRDGCRIRSRRLPRKYGHEGRGLNKGSLEGLGQEPLQGGALSTDEPQLSHATMCARERSPTQLCRRISPKSPPFD